MTVADVHGARPDDDRLGDAVTAADNHVEALDIELFHECRKERQTLAVVVADAGQMLQQRGMNLRPLDQG
jgi:hypothetical protein